MLSTASVYPRVQFSTDSYSLMSATILFSTNFLTRRPKFKFFNARKLWWRHTCYCWEVVIIGDVGVTILLPPYIPKSHFSNSGMRGHVTCSVLHSPRSVEWDRNLIISIREDEGFTRRVQLGDVPLEMAVGASDRMTYNVSNGWKVVQLMFECTNENDGSAMSPSIYVPRVGLTCTRQ